MITLKLSEVIENNVNIFDFNYPIHREEYRATFEQNFKDYFYSDEIAHETVALFKQRLKLKLNLIMPTYNKLIMTQELEQRILDNYDVTEIYTRDVNSNTNSDSTSTNKNMYKDAPKTKIDVDKFDVLTNLSKDEGSNQNNISSTNTENWKRTMTGNIGIQTDSHAIQEFWKSLRNVEEEIFEELQILFMGVIE